MGSIWTKLMSALSGCKKGDSKQTVIDQANTSLNEASNGLNRMVACHTIAVREVEELNENIALLEASAQEARNTGNTARAKSVEEEIANFTEQRDFAKNKADALAASIESMQALLADAQKATATLSKS